MMPHVKLRANMLRIHHLLVRVTIALGGGGESESGHSQLSPLPPSFCPKPSDEWGFNLKLDKVLENLKIILRTDEGHMSSKQDHRDHPRGTAGWMGEHLARKK